MMNPLKVAAGRGRPRDEALDTRITEVALAELADHGYAGMSVDSVAQRAGVSKATIYRRYRDKADLVTDAIACQKPIVQATSDQGSARSQLIAMLERSRQRMIADGQIRIMLQILAESERNPQLLALHRERTVAARRVEYDSIFDLGVATGELRADFDRELIFEICIGSWLARHAVGNAFGDRWAEQVVDSFWGSIAAG